MRDRGFYLSGHGARLQHAAARALHVIRGLKWKERSALRVTPSSSTTGHSRILLPWACLPIRPKAPSTAARRRRVSSRDFCCAPALALLNFAHEHAKMPIPFFGSGAINYSLPASSNAFLPDRRLILSELLRPCASAARLPTTWRPSTANASSAADLKTLRLDQLQWVWNFAPFIVDCIHSPLSRVSLDEHACQLGEKAGASVAFNKGLVSLDKFGYGVPVSTTWCAWGPHAIEPYAEVQRALPGLGGNEHVLEVIRVRQRCTNAAAAAR